MIDDPFSMGDDDVSGGNESGGGDDESSSGSDFGGNYLDNYMLTTYWCITNEKKMILLELKSATKKKILTAKAIPRQEKIFEPIFLISWGFESWWKYFY